ncbi:hypothetical protein BN973_00510 [Mycobacterium triplex]|uniref:Uncharacterized protein n=1 Tax=Mycobacterium triplex TaxID=47839 RepID=A0A024JRH9_9MYCO|nr:hypothetical protein BN973_00510 [Mycobacterium triplex]
MDAHATGGRLQLSALTLGGSIAVDFGPVMVRPARLRYLMR